MLSMENESLVGDAVFTVDPGAIGVVPVDDAADAHDDVLLSGLLLLLSIVSSEVISSAV